MSDKISRASKLISAFAGTTMLASCASMPITGGNRHEAALCAQNARNGVPGFTIRQGSNPVAANALAVLFTAGVFNSHLNNTQKILGAFGAHQVASTSKQMTCEANTPNWRATYAL